MPAGTLQTYDLRRVKGGNFLRRLPDLGGDQTGGHLPRPGFCLQLGKEEERVGHIIPQVREFSLQLFRHPARRKPEECLAESSYQEKDKEGNRPQGIDESDIPEGLPQGQGEETPQQSQEKGG